MKFKEGDKVVTLPSAYIIGSPSNPIPTGTEGVLVGTYIAYRSDLLIVNFNGQSQYVYDFEIELEHIYNSPLAKALR